MKQQLNINKNIYLNTPKNYYNVKIIYSYIYIYEY